MAYSTVHLLHLLYNTHLYFHEWEFWNEKHLLYRFFQPSQRNSTQSRTVKLLSRLFLYLTWSILPAWKEDHESIYSSSSLRLIFSNQNLDHGFKTYVQINGNFLKRWTQEVCKVFCINFETKELVLYQYSKLILIQYLY